MLNFLTHSYLLKKLHCVGAQAVAAHLTSRELLTEISHVGKGLSSHYRGANMGWLTLQAVANSAHFFSSVGPFLTCKTLLLLPYMDYQVSQGGNHIRRHSLH